MENYQVWVMWVANIDIIQKKSMWYLYFFFRSNKMYGAVIYIRKNNVIDSVSVTNTENHMLAKAHIASMFVLEHLMQNLHLKKVILFLI